MKTSRARSRQGDLAHLQMNSHRKLSSHARQFLWRIDPDGLTAFGNVLDSAVANIGRLWILLTPKSISN